MRVVFPELEKKSDIKERKGQAKFSHRPTQLIGGGGGKKEDRIQENFCRSRGLS